MIPRSVVAVARARAGLDDAGGIPFVPPARPSMEPAGGSRPQPYKDWYAPVELLTACMYAHGLQPRDRVLVFAESRMEWFQADLAVMALGAMTVPVFPTLPAAQVEEILRDSGASAAFVSNTELLAELRRAAASAGLKLIVLMSAPVPQSEEAPDFGRSIGPSGGSDGRQPDFAVPGGGLNDHPSDLALPDGGSNGHRAHFAAPAVEPGGLPADIAAPPGGPALLLWKEALAAGRALAPAALSELAVRARTLQLEDPATLIYTSGTTGRMKGVLLTHGNLLSSAISSARRIQVTSDDVYLSFLPMAHVLERVVHLSMLWAGARIHYGGGLDRLEEDFRRVRPTVIVGVPRLFEKIVRGAAERAGRLGPRGRFLFKLAERAARRAGRRGPHRRPPGPMAWLWEIIVYRKVRRVVGGRARILISGGAPLGAREQSFLNGCGLAVLEGYGLTETASVCAVNTLSEWRRGSVGRPLPEIELKVTDGGEILVRGPSVTGGYWNDEEATRAALHDGWLHTGDLGRIDDDGYLFLTGRKKDLIVTAQGKNLAPSLVEEQLRRSPLVHDALVVGDRRPFPVALVYPELEVLRARLGLALAEGPGLRRSLESQSVRSLYRAEIDRACEALAPHETVRDFVLLADRPSVVEGSLTPTLKLRRGELERRYAVEIRKMYDRAGR